MRRFYGYLVLIVSVLLIVCCSIQPQVQQITSGLDFNGGYEAVYKVDLKDSDKKIDDISKIVMNRLEDAKVDNAQVEAETEQEGIDNISNFIRIKTSASSEENLDYVLRSVESTGKITVSTLMDDANYPELVEPFEIGSAEVNWNSSKPYVQVKVKNPEEFKKFTENCDEDYKAFNDKYNSSSDNSNSEINGVMVIWLNKDENDKEGDSYLAAYQEQEEVKRDQIRSKILAIVPTNNFHYTTNSNNQMTDVKLLISYYDFEQTEMNANSAHTVERIINYESSDYSMTRLYTQKISASAGEGYDQIILWGIFASLIVLLAVLIVVYGLAGLAGWTAIALSMFVQLTLFNFFGYSFSMMVGIGFIISLVINAASVILYLHKFKNELYKGKSAIKANQEANKSSVVNVFDIAILVLFITIIASVSVSNQVKMLPVSMMIGAGCALILNRLLMIFAMWWLTDNKLALNHKKIFMVKDKDIPDIMKMETQTKFNPLHKFDPRKNQKRNTIIAGVISGVCIILISIFALIPSMGVFNQSSESKEYSRVEIQAELEKTHYVFETQESVKEFFKEKYPELKVSGVDINVVKDVIVVNNTNTEHAYDFKTDMVYISVKVDNLITHDEYYNSILTDIESLPYGQSDYTDVNITTCAPESVNYLLNSSITVVSIFAGLAIAFVLIRFGYTYAIASLASIIPAALISLGFFSATRLEISALSLVGIGAGLIVMIIAELPLFEKMKKLKHESKVKVTTYGQRESIAIEACQDTMITTISISLVALCATIIVACFSPLTSSVLSFYGSMAIAILVGAVGNMFILIPVYLFMEKHIRLHFSINHEKRNKKRMEKAKEQNRKAGLEPEESLIPGINC